MECNFRHYYFNLVLSVNWIFNVKHLEGKELYGREIMFFTVFFTVDGLAHHKVHNGEDDQYDDNPIEWVSHCDFEYDGYVSNVGKKATIHIKKECMSEENIHSIKNFFLQEPNGLESIEIEMY